MALRNLIVAAGVWQYGRYWWIGEVAVRSVDTWHDVLASRPARNSRGGPVTTIEHPFENEWCTP